MMRQDPAQESKPLAETGLLSDQYGYQNQAVFWQGLTFLWFVKIMPLPTFYDSYFSRSKDSCGYSPYM
jgi:hypothetical protein